MAVDFSNFTSATTIPTSANFVGYDVNASGGEKKWTLSTVANAVSGIISPITTTNAAIKFNDFTTGTNATIQSDDFVVGYDTAVLGGERRWTLSTIANAVSGIMSSELTNIFVEESKFTGTNQSLTTNGYQRLPGGLIIQWGISASGNTDANYTLTLPIAFTNSFLSGTTCILNASITNDDVFSKIVTTTTTQIQVRFEAASGAVLSGTRYIYYIVFGY